MQLDEVPGGRLARFSLQEFTEKATEVRRYRPFDRSQLELKPLAQRTHDININAIMPLQPVSDLTLPARTHVEQVAQAIKRAKGQGAASVLMIGAHVIRAGVQHYLIDLMRAGFITCLAMNGAGMIHDFELALVGATTESVPRYIRTGEFGMWQETGQINDIINQAYADDLHSGLGTCVGRVLHEGDFAHKDISVLAEAYRLGTLVTVHVAIGCDIIHQHPNCDGAATGALTYNDFLLFTQELQRLEGGVLMNFGSAVMAPEVYLKALSMVRNLAAQEGQTIGRFTNLVCDLREMPADFTREPSKGSPAYFFRPWKTMLVRTVADGGVSYYVKGPHHQTIPALWTALQ